MRRVKTLETAILRATTDDELKALRDEVEWMPWYNVDRKRLLVMINQQFPKTIDADERVKRAQSIQ